jgi:hypothetical protein
MLTLEVREWIAQSCFSHSDLFHLNFDRRRVDVGDLLKWALAMVGVASATHKSLTHATKKRLLLISLIALSTFFVFLVELEHIHVVRYHAQTQNDGPLTVDERLADFKHQQESPRASLPPLDSIIDKNMNIIGDPQPLLDFAIIGFGKCGTSTLMYAQSFRLILFSSLQEPSLTSSLTNSQVLACRPSSVASNST